LRSLPLARALVAEAIGTFALVFAGCGAIMVDEKTGALGHVGVAITFGLVIMAMIYAVGHVSGAHFNPAVTFSFALARHFPKRHLVPYWGAQLVGALIAAAILRGSLGNIAHVGATYPSGSDGQAFLWEAVLSFFLMFVIMAVATDTQAVGEPRPLARPGDRHRRPARDLDLPARADRRRLSRGPGVHVCAGRSAARCGRVSSRP